MYNVVFRSLNRFSFSSFQYNSKAVYIARNAGKNVAVVVAVAVAVTLKCITGDLTKYGCTKFTSYHCLACKNGS